MKGKISTFGGSDDTGMTKTEGLALYEHNEADKRPDLFLPRSEDLTLGTSQRLRPDALFFAYRFVKANRKSLQLTPWLFTNPLNGLSIPLWLCDWGPHERTGRIFDISPRAAMLLRLKTDDEVEAISLP